MNILYQYRNEINEIELSYNDYMENDKLFLYSSTISVIQSNIYNIMIYFSMPKEKNIFIFDKLQIEDITVNKQTFLEQNPNDYEPENNLVEYISKLVRSGEYNYELIYKKLDLFQK